MSMKGKISTISLFIIMTAVFVLIDRLYALVFDKEMSWGLFIVITFVIGSLVVSFLIKKNKRQRIEEICRDYLRQFQLVSDEELEHDILLTLKFRLNNNKKYVNSYTKDEEFDECALRQLLFVCNLLLSTPHNSFKSITRDPTLYNIGQDAIKTLVEKGYIDEAIGDAAKDELLFSYESRNKISGETPEE